MSPRLEIMNGQPVGSPVRHHTISRVISGSVAVRFTGTRDNKFKGSMMLIESISEPSEDVIGGTAVKVEVLHLERPLEWVAPSYDGGTVTITIAEVQTPGRRSAYRAAGFHSWNEFVDVMNHYPFDIIIIYENSDATKTVQTLHNCRLLNPIRPNAPLARGTLRRQLQVPVGYTHRTTDETLTSDPTAGGALGGVIDPNTVA